MKSENRSWRQLAGISLLAVSLCISLVLLFLTERSYGAFRETLRNIQFEIRLTGVEQIGPQQVRLRWIATVTAPTLKVPSWLELLDWKLYSADESVYLGFYTTSEIQIALASGREIPLEAVVEGPNFEKLQRLREQSSEVALLFQGTARVMFRAPQGEVRKKLPAVGIFTLPKEGDGL
ncbi:MAG: hypothetical protein ACK4HB_01135 [Candidatus Bipolaricaulia bacterium]